MSATPPSIASRRFERVRRAQVGRAQRVIRAVVTVSLAVLLGCSDERDRTQSEARAPDATARGTTSPNETAAAADGSSIPQAVVEDDGPIGSAGRQLLSASIPAVVIEVDRSPAAQLHVDIHAVLGEELREHGNKQSVLRAEEGIVPAKDAYTAADLRAIAAASRDTPSAASRPAVYVLVLEGRYENDRVTGVAFSATSFAIFPEQISDGLIGLEPESFETAVLVHELGHLFGLVDLTGEGAFHEDPQRPGHSSSEASVMYWAVEDVSITNVFRGGPPREFDDADREEIARIRAA